MSDAGYCERIVTYRGKQLDNTAAVLLMAMEAVGVEDVPHPNCLTTRPFSRRCPLGTPPLWLSPFTDPWDGLLLALETLGVRKTCRLVTTIPGDGLAADMLDTVEQWLRDGPVIVGPLNRSRIWDRIESRYYHGEAHFVLVIEYGGDCRLVVHDPEGCPYFLVSQKRLLAALEVAGFEGGALQVLSASDLRPREEILRQAFLAGVRSRTVAASQPEGGGSGLRALAQEVASKRLRSSEEGALNFAIPSLGLAIRQVAEFLLDMPDTVTTALLYGKNLKPRALEVLSEYCVDCAHALEHLKTRNQEGLSARLLKMARHEELLNELFAHIVELEANDTTLGEGGSG